MQAGRMWDADIQPEELLPGLHVTSSINTAARLSIVLIPSVMKWQRRSRLCIMLSLKKSVTLVFLLSAETSEVTRSENFKEVNY